MEDDTDVIPSAVEDFDFGFSSNVDVDLKGQSQHNASTDTVRLQKLWIQEVNAPELLPYQTMLVDDMLELVANQQGLLEEALEGEDPNILYYNLLQMEVDRIRHMIRAYLRARLMKIEKYAFYTVGNIEVESRLSEHERDHARAYTDLVEEHFNESFLRHIPNQKNREIPDTNQFPGPNLDCHVIVRAEEDIGDIQIDEGKTATLEKGEILITPYRAVRNLVRTHQVELI